MNAARAMGNPKDSKYVADLAAAISENGDERAQAMAASALGRIGEKRARVALESVRHKATGMVPREIDAALKQL
jgi:epoxyqueuosine reductase